MSKAMDDIENYLKMTLEPYKRLSNVIYARLKDPFMDQNGDENNIRLGKGEPSPIQTRLIELTNRIGLPAWLNGLS